MMSDERIATGKAAAVVGSSTVVNSSVTEGCFFSFFGVAPRKE